MKNIILISLVVISWILIIYVRYNFSIRLAEFELSINEIEKENLEYAHKAKNKTMVAASHAGLLNCFNQFFEESSYIIKKDTTFAFLYLKKRVIYKAGQISYLDCLIQKCITEKQNEFAQSQILKKEKELELLFESTFTEWYPKLKEDKLLQKTYKSDNCSKFFSNLYLISYDESFWDEFEKFMTTYDNERRAAQIKSLIAHDEYARNEAVVKSQLSSDILSYFDDKLSSARAKIYSMETVNKTYNSPLLGVIEYSVSIVKFDKQVFQSVADETFEQQWKSHSLNNGAMPYSNCYGSSNNCNDWECSQIKVKTGGSGDVLVTVKNNYGNVVRHAYIEGGNSYTFNIPDGNYQVFFYSGIGWNPNKKMPSSACNYLLGGFVSNESFTKDSYISLNGQIMTYELILQQDGNFNAKPSSQEEAF